MLRGVIKTSASTWNWVMRCFAPCMRAFSQYEYGWFAKTGGASEKVHEPRCYSLGDCIEHDMYGVVGCMQQGAERREHPAIPGAGTRGQQGG